MEYVVFKIGNGKVVHYGTRYVDGIISSSCNNSFANDRHKDLKEYSSLEEITCKTCHAHKKWYEDIESMRKDLKEKSKTFKLKEIEEVKIGNIYKEKANFCFPSKYELTKAKVLSIESVVVNSGEVHNIVIVAMLDKDLNPVQSTKWNGEKTDIKNHYTVEYFKERFYEIDGNVKNA